MNQKDLFSTLGVKVIPHFLEPQFCDLIIEEMRQGVKKKASVILKETDGKNVYDKDFRETDSISMSKKIRQQIQQIVKKKLQPILEEFFGLKLEKGILSMEFLSYKEGHFFKQHKDKGEKGEISKREVSVVIFLNQKGIDFDGGDLYLYGLFHKASKKGVPIPNKKGLLVSFKSDEYHEVTPIIWGNRCSLVIWFG